MTPAQKGGEWNGLYVDNDLTYWKWTCEKPPDAPDDDGSNDRGERGTGTGGGGVAPACSNYNDKTMEWILWVIYLSGEAWIFGYVIMLPGGAVFFWHMIQAVMMLGSCEFGEWFAGVGLSAFFTQWLIYFLALYATLVPGLNFISSFLLGWWAVADYYGYNYELFAGPTLPAA